MTPRAELHRTSPVRTWLGLNRSPLLRASDRIEILARWVAVAVAVVGLSLAAMVTNAVENGLAAGAQQAGLSPATATLLEDASTHLPLGMEPSARHRTQATWTAPNGTAMDGLVTTTATAQEVTGSRCSSGPTARSRRPLCRHSSARSSAPPPGLPYRCSRWSQAGCGSRWCTARCGDHASATGRPPGPPSTTHTAAQGRDPLIVSATAW